MASIKLNNVVKRYGTGPKANQVIHGVNADADLAVNSSSSSAPAAAASPPSAHGGRAGEISGGEIAIGDRVVNNLSPPNATSPWCSRTTRSTRT